MMLMNIFRVGVVVRIAEDMAFIVAQYQAVLIPADGILGKQRYLSTTARCVHYLGRHGVAAGVAAQALNDFQSFADGRAEVRGAGDRVALIQIVGADADL